MASHPGSEPQAPHSERPASPSTTSAPKRGSDIRETSVTARNITSDPVLREACKPSLPLLKIKRGPRAKGETPPNRDAVGEPLPRTSRGPPRGSSFPGLEPQSTLSERPASSSTTSTPERGSDIQKQSIETRKIVSDPLFKEASKSSARPIGTKREPGTKHETRTNMEAALAPIPSTSRGPPRGSSFPALEPQSPLSERPASSSTTSTPERGRDIQKQSINTRKIVSDPLFKEASKSSAHPVGIKREPGTKHETPTNTDAAFAPIPSTSRRAPRREEPRKQRRQVKELCSTDSSGGGDDIVRKRRKGKKKRFSRGAGMKCMRFCYRKKAPPRRRSPSWDARQNHFIRHDEVNLMDDKKQTVTELASQEGASQKAKGWKMVHLTTQLDEVSDLENTVQKRLSALQDVIEEKPAAIQAKPLDPEEEEILSKIKELTKGNLQRSKMVQEQVCDAKQKMLKVLEHRPHIMDIIGRYNNKRPQN